MNPFTNERSKSVAALGEVQLLNFIRNYLGPDLVPASPYGIGDDCAVLPSPHHQQIISTDAVIWGRHFDDSASAVLAGEKLIKRNLSDIAAMGGEANALLICLLLAPNTSFDYLQGFYEGIKEVARSYTLKIIGGDISTAPHHFFAAYATILGEAKRPINRHGGQIGDSLWVTGSLGGSLLGHHLHFKPRLQEGVFLSQHTGVKSLIDLTDGLAKDCLALCPKGAEACLDLNKIPISPAAHAMTTTSGNSALQHAFCDGEDYELLFTLDAHTDEAQFLAAWKNALKTPLQKIGYLTPMLDIKQGPCLRSAETQSPLPPWRGYEHLNPSEPA